MYCQYKLEQATHKQNTNFTCPKKTIEILVKLAFKKLKDYTLKLINLEDTTWGFYYTKHSTKLSNTIIMTKENETEAYLWTSRIDPEKASNAGWGVIEHSQIKREGNRSWTYPAWRSCGKQRCDYVLIYRTQTRCTWGEASWKQPPWRYRTGKRLCRKTEYARGVLIKWHWRVPDEHDHRILRWNGGWLPSPQQLWDMKFTDHYEWRDRFVDVPFEDDGGKWQPRYYIVSNDVASSPSQEAIVAYFTPATGKARRPLHFSRAWKFSSPVNLSGCHCRPDFVPCRQEHFADQDQHIFGLPWRLCRPHWSRPLENAGLFPKTPMCFLLSFRRSTMRLTARWAIPPDFFDFIIIDECHRGGANDESQYEPYSSILSVSRLTATPKRRYNVDTYAYWYLRHILA